MFGTLPHRGPRTEATDTVEVSGLGRPDVDSDCPGTPVVRVDTSQRSGVSGLQTGAPEGPV